MKGEFHEQGPPHGHGLILAFWLCAVLVLSFGVHRTVPRERLTSSPGEAARDVPDFHLRRTGWTASWGPRRAAP